jgi:spectinomycin phosphotransferase
VLEKPNLGDEVILTGLRERYGILASGVTFLPIGNDSTAWVYRVTASDGAGYFLKVKRGAVDPASLIVPRYVRDHGMTQAVAPLPVRDGDLSARLDPFTLILYPFIEGENGMSAGLTDAQWVEYGEALRRLHATPLSPEIEALVRREDFRPWWSATVRAILVKVAGEDFTDPAERELAKFLRARSAEVGRIVDRAEELGARVRADPPECVLCHADIHTANVLVSPDGLLYVVDWDNPVLAPRERDLMFVVSGSTVRSRDEQLFFAGYGETPISPLALAYYRYEWVVQDIGDYAARVFLTPDTGEETKRDAVAGLTQMFDRGDVVESAYAAERDLPPEPRR